MKFEVEDAEFEYIDIGMQMMDELMDTIIVEMRRIKNEMCEGIVEEDGDVALLQMGEGNGDC